MVEVHEWPDAGPLLQVDCRSWADSWPDDEWRNEMQEVNFSEKVDELEKELMCHGRTPSSREGAECYCWTTTP